MHENSLLLFEKYAKEYFRPGLRILEVGPSTIPSPYEISIGEESHVWETLDIVNDSQLTYGGVAEYDFPIPSDTYDIVLSGQVVEHVKRIWIWMPELARICRTGGYVITVCPVSWPYHEAPVDCWRIFPEGMRALYDDAGLEVILSKFDSLEGKRFRRTTPGRGMGFQSRRMRMVYRVLNLFGFPVECAYDTITVGKKKPYDGA